MSLIEVAIPMRRGRRRFHVEKGRRWSVIEHLMLEAVSRAPATTAELSKRSNLHRRIVVEAFIRLMRAGWVEIIDNPSATIFRATVAGKEQIKFGELRGLTTIRPRMMSFAYDRVTGQAFRGSEFSIRARNRILKSSDADALVFLSPDPRKDAEDLSQIYSALEGDNEVIIGSDSSPHLPIEGYAVVRVMGGVIDDVSARAEQPLRSAILKAASAAATPAAKTNAGTEVTGHRSYRLDRTRSRRTLRSERPDTWRRGAQDGLLGCLVARAGARRHPFDFHIGSSGRFPEADTGRGGAECPGRYLVGAIRRSYGQFHVPHRFVDA
ncbi:hypothetical protein ACVWWR_005295 [Bradyrhizobium sp. LM3.2]